jgi:hypothetical protein
MPTRRHLFKTVGISTLALAATGSGTMGLRPTLVNAQQDLDRFSFGPGTPKPVPSLTSADPAAQSQVETLFWTDIMMEHGVLLASLLPGDELAPLRQQAVGFARSFEGYLGQVQGMAFDTGNYRSINQQTIAMVQPFIDFKHTVHELQESGQIHSHVYPSLAMEAAEEAEHFVLTLHNLSAGNAQRDPNELIPFWLTGMEGHALLFAHQLDPKEMELMDQAHGMAARFAGMRESRISDLGAIDRELDQLIGFKDWARDAIDAGQIASIIHPAVMDHMRREAVKAQDEVRFVGRIAGIAK